MSSDGSGDPLDEPIVPNSRWRDPGAIRSGEQEFLVKRLWVSEDGVTQIRIAYSSGKSVAVTAEDMIERIEAGGIERVDD